MPRLGPEHRVHLVTRAAIRAFAASIGEVRPVHHSVAAARANGHPDLLAPPTYLFGPSLREGDPFGWAVEAGLDMRRALHGEQSFRYHAPVHAGEELRLVSRCAPLETHSGWDRLHRTTWVHRDDAIVAVLRTTLLCKREAA